MCRPAHITSKASFCLCRFSCNRRSLSTHQEAEEPFELFALYFLRSLYPG